MKIPDGITKLLNFRRIFILYDILKTKNNFIWLSKYHNNDL